MWEYRIVTEAANNTSAITLLSVTLGALGWEACGMAAADPTLGFNTISILFKRAVLPWPLPDDTSPAWAIDPTGRFAFRYWDGLRWTEHVSTDDGTKDTDLPNRR
jgi:hypothetical protein